MRLQSAVICDRYERTEGHGFNFIGVSPTLIVEGTYQGPPDTPHPPIPINKKIVLILLDGENGPHRFFLNVQFSERDTPISAHPFSFDWPDNAPSHLLEIDLNMRVPGEGLYDFQILIDGEALTTIPLQIITNITRSD